jgi:hypothetical protein
MVGSARRDLSASVRFWYGRGRQRNAGALHPKWPLYQADAITASLFPWNVHHHRPGLRKQRRLRALKRAYGGKETTIHTQDDVEIESLAERRIGTPVLGELGSVVR